MAARYINFWQIKGIVSSFTILLIAVCQLEECGALRNEEAVDCPEGLPVGCSCAEWNESHPIYSMIVGNRTDVEVVYDFKQFRT